ncbi:MAG: DUF434 domain-containing protein [Candidatus Freyrarchaeum guaymaensis]
MFINRRIIEAAEDLRYLLNRNYNRDQALTFVGDHYRLHKEERFILYRAIYSQKEVRERKEKTISFEELQGKTLTIDAYNVIIVLETMLKGKELIESDDSFVRDISGVFGKHKITKTTRQAISLIMQALKQNPPKKTLIFFDSPVSKSGELAAITRKKMEEYGINGTAQIVKQADNAVIRRGEVAATSDSVILQKAKKTFDLAGYIVREKNYKHLYPIRKT